MTKAHSIRDLAISESGFVFDPFSGGTFTVDATGQGILKGLRDGLTAEEIVDDVFVLPYASSKRRTQHDCAR